MKLIKGLTLAIIINSLITLPALIMAVAIGHGFWGLWAGCGVVLGLSMVDEQSREILRRFSYMGLVLAVLMTTVLNAGVGWFFSWSPWLVAVLPAFNLLNGCWTAFMERPTPRREAQPPSIAHSDTIDPATVVFWGQDAHAQREEARRGSR